jgi:ribonuclease HI
LTEVVAIYADGGVIGANPSTTGGTWALCHVDAAGERIRHASGVLCARGILADGVTNNMTEMAALVYALESLPDEWSGQVYSDSQVTLGRIFYGWKNKNLPISIVMRARAAVSRLGRLHPVLLGGHPTAAELTTGTRKNGMPVSKHNVWCDGECGRIGRIHSEQLKTIGSK